MQNTKKIVGLDFEKFDKVYFRDIHTDIQTDPNDLIWPSHRGSKNVLRRASLFLSPKKWKEAHRCTSFFSYQYIPLVWQPVNNFLPILQFLLLCPFTIDLGTGWGWGWAFICYTASCLYVWSPVFEISQWNLLPGHNIWYKKYQKLTNDNRNRYQNLHSSTLVLKYFSSKSAHYYCTKRSKCRVF